MLTSKGSGLGYTTTQTSGDSTIDVYWDIVNNRYINIHNKVGYAYDVDWINGCIKDAERGISYCDKPNLLQTYSAKLISHYKQQFLRIIKELERIKEIMQ